MPLAAVDQLRRNRLVAQVIPVSLGDNFQGFRIVGTEPSLLEHYGARFAAGGSWGEPMQAVIGADVARATRLGVGGALHGTHGLAQGGAVHEAARYEVVGVLQPTGTVLDRLILTDKASVWHVHEENPSLKEGRPGSEAEREVTALLVRYATPMAAAIVPRQVNAESRLMAASPASELARLFAVVGVGIDTMRVFGGVLVLIMLFSPEGILQYDVKTMVKPACRMAAISRALAIASARDVIVLAGKGHETYQVRGTTKYPFDEKVIVAELSSESEVRSVR